MALLDSTLLILILVLTPYDFFSPLGTHYGDGVSDGILQL